MNKTFAYVTDSHFDEQFPIDQQVDARHNWELLLQDISSRGIHNLIFGGDIGEISAHKWFFESLRHYNISITLGNHDDYHEVIKHYPFKNADKQTELYYSQEQDFHKCLFLDSSSGTISQEQFDWLKKELVTIKDIILFIHHPILAVNAEVDKQFALKERDRLTKELLNIKNKVTIFCGHYHFEDEKKEGTIQQYITPASSYQVEKLPDEIKVNNHTFGYRIIELNNQDIHTELVTFTSIKKSSK